MLTTATNAVKYTLKAKVSFMRLFIDIHSKSPYPSGSLSNFADHPYCLDGVPIRCQEGLLQSLKVPPELQRTICLADARTAKEIGSSYNWQENGAIFHWNGTYFSRYSKEYHDFLKRSYDALVDQNEDFVKALRDSGHAILWHSIGKFSKKRTCLTTFEFLSLLYRARRMARQHFS